MLARSRAASVDGNVTPEYPTSPHPNPSPSTSMRAILATFPLASGSDAPRPMTSRSVSRRASRSVGIDSRLRQSRENPTLGETEESGVESDLLGVVDAHVVSFLAVGAENEGISFLACPAANSMHGTATIRRAPPRLKASSPSARNRTREFEVSVLDGDALPPCLGRGRRRLRIVLTPRGLGFRVRRASPRRRSRRESRRSESRRSWTRPPRGRRAAAISEIGQRLGVAPVEGRARREVAFSSLKERVAPKAIGDVLSPVRRRLN